MLFHRGSPGNTLYIIESGIARIVSLREREKDAEPLETFTIQVEVQ